MTTLRKGGPETCPRPCGECSEAHHFSDAMLECAETSEEGADHEAAKVGVEVWYECKHCEAWMEYDLDGEDGDDEEEPDGEADHEDDPSGADCGTPRQVQMSWLPEGPLRFGLGKLGGES